MEDSNVNKTQIYEEFLGLEENELKGLGVDHRAFEHLKGQLMDDMDFLEGENQVIDPNDPKYIAKQNEWAKRAQIQQKLFEADLLGTNIEESKIQNNQDQSNNIGIDQLCKLRTRGYTETVLRLTEIFLPAEEDPIRIAMDNYNKQKLPRLRNMLDPKLTEQRKRNIKNQIKTSNENLKNRLRKPLQSQNANLQFLLNEKLNQEQISQTLEARHGNLQNIQKSQVYEKEKLKAQKTILGSRTAPSKTVIEENSNKTNLIHKKQKQNINESQTNQKNEEQIEDIKKSILSKNNINLNMQQNDQLDVEKLKCEINQSRQYYEELEKDGRIREAMTKCKFIKLSKANPESKPFARRKYWGELKDAVSQKQIDKDFNLYRYFESNLPNEVNSKEPTFFLRYNANQSSKFQGAQPDFEENADPDNQIQFSTEYGSLNLINANTNNFKIQNVSEYEFVQRQRAFIYDPLHLKGSQQLKSFSALVGFGSLNDQKTNPQHQITLQKDFDKEQTVQNLCQNIESQNHQVKQLKDNSNHISNEMLEVYNILGIQPKTNIDPSDKDQQLDPIVLLGYNQQNLNGNISKSHSDLRKLKNQKGNTDTIININDNFDKLTDNVKIRKLEDLIQRKQEEENRKNAINEKKYPSTAYRELNLQITKPRIQRKDSQDQDILSQDKKDGYNQINSDSKHINGKQQNFDNEMQDEDKSESQEFDVQNNENFVKSQDDIEMNEIDGNEVDENISESTNEDKLFYEDVPDANVSQQATHAKCIFDLSFTKFEWNSTEDYTKCHRPDISALFQSERDKMNSQDNISQSNFPLQNSNTQISIGAFGDVRIMNQFNQKPQNVENQNNQEIVEVPLCIIDRETVKSKNKKRGIINADEYFKDRVKLSLKDGKFCLFEHIDQHPIFVNNFGMVSKLQRYIYSDNYVPRQEFLPSSNNNKVKHMGPYGQQILKGASSKLPLLGNIDKSKFQGITILSNKLYRAPVFFHKTQPTDFFCSFHEDKKGQKRIVLREIQSIYTVGQIEPIISVYDPQSRSYQNFIKQRCQAYILRFLKENNNQLDFQNIQNIFSYLTDQKLKKFIKEIQVEVNRDQICSSTKQINDETIKNLITPEMICQYESSRYGEAMLTKSGIESITKAGKISYASNRYCQDQKNILRQKISKFIENEVLCTPWNLSSNFCTIHSSHTVQAHSGMLMIKGVGDPSNGNGGYSFLKMPLKISNDSLQDCMKIRVDLNPAIQNPKSVTGTDADLRKLKKEVIFNKLVEMGYDNREIMSMTRWNMVGLLREQSRTNQLDEKNKRFARGIRFTSKTQREVYHKRVDELFRTQMMYLTAQRDLNDDSDYEDPTQSLNVPALKNKNQQGKNLNDDIDQDSQDGDILGFNQMEGIQKFTVEITDKQKINELLNEKPSLNDNGEDNNRAGYIQKIFDIPNFRKLLLVKIEAPNQNIQPGQQIGLFRSGAGQINSNENNNQSKTAEQILEEGLENKTLELNYEILKKVIRNEDNLAEIERMEFISAEKVVNQFKKRQKKCKTRRAKKRITNLKLLQKSTDQQTVDLDNSRQLTSQSNPNQIKLESSQINKNQINLFQKHNSQLSLTLQSLQSIDLQGSNINESQKGKTNVTNSLNQKQKQNDANDQLFQIPLKSNEVSGDAKRSQIKQTKVTTLGQLSKGENIDQVLKNQDKMNMQLKNRSNGQNEKDGGFKMPISVNQNKDSKSNSRYKGHQSISSSSTITKPNNKSIQNPQKNLNVSQDQNSTIINLEGQLQQFNDLNNLQNNDISQLALNPLFQRYINPNGQFIGQQLQLNNDTVIQINPDYQIQQNIQANDTEITINLGQKNTDFSQANDANKMQIFNNNAINNFYYDDQQDVNMKQEDQAQKNKKSQKNKQENQEKKAQSKKQKQVNDQEDQYSSQNWSKQQHNDKSEMLIASLHKEQENSMRANKKLQSSRRAKQSGESILNSVIEQIVEDCIKQDPKMIFRYRVEKKVAPGYYGIIKQPICLEDMKHKAKRQEYKSVQSFKDDMTLMKTNCELYNGLTNEISQIALYLEQHSFQLLQSKEYNDLIQTAALKIDYQK